MKKKAIMLVIGCVGLSIYILGYYSARKDHLLVRRLHSTYNDKGDIQTIVTVERGNFGPGKGGILTSPDEINFCYLVFTPLRLLESKHQNMKSSNQRLEAIGDPGSPQPQP